MTDRWQRLQSALEVAQSTTLECGVVVMVRPTEKTNHLYRQQFAVLVQDPRFRSRLEMQVGWTGALTVARQWARRGGRGRREVEREINRQIRTQRSHTETEKE